MKLVLVGDEACGLTAMVRRYLSNEIYNVYMPTVIDVYNVTVHLRNFKIKLEIIDTAGQEDFKEIRKLNLLHADVVIIGYPCNYDFSLENVKHVWIPEVKSVTAAPCIWFVQR